MNDICEILKSAKTIAVLGISSNINKTSTGIARYLKKNGYNVVGVNPNKSFTYSGDIKIYNNLREIPHKINIVNVFRKAEDIHSIIDDVIAAAPDVLWLQLGIRNDSAVSSIEKAGIKVIQDTCIKIEHNYCF